MRILLSLLLSTLLAGCSIIPSTPSFSSVGKLSDSDIAKRAVAVVKAEDTSKQVDQMAEANKKVEAARQQMEIKYAAAKAEIQKSYDDLKKKDDENFTKIGELNYGIYIVTQEKKKQDMNTLVAHLRAKEIMNRTDKNTPEQKAAIAAEVVKEKALTIDQLYTKYNGAVELAIVQKQALDNAQTLIDQKEKEKAALREAEKLTLDKLQAERNAELGKIKKEASDQLALANAAQKAERVGLIFKTLLGIGALFLILAILFKKPSWFIGSIACFGLAYMAATIELWVVATSMGGVVILMLIVEHAKTIKAKATSNPKNTASG